jgi:hypothetical protein
MAIPQISKRMSALPAMPTGHDAQNPDTVQDIQDNVNGVAAEWVIGVDSLRRTNAPAGYIEGSDGGTQFIPMSRIAMRDTHGKIPANMLPSYIDDMMFGSMIFEYTDERAIFIEHYYDEHTHSEQTRTYSSPANKRRPEEYEPPANIIYVDSVTEESVSGHKATMMQFRFVADQSTVEPSYGFIEVPGSRVITPGYGLLKNDGTGTVPETHLYARMADFFTMYASAGPREIGNSYTYFPFDKGNNKSESSATQERPSIDATLDTTNNCIHVSGLTTNARYCVDLQLLAAPKTLSANIINVSFKCGTVPDQIQQMDMSGPSGTQTKLDFHCEFKTRTASADSIDLQIKSEEAINVTTTRFTIFELL